MAVWSDVKRSGYSGIRTVGESYVWDPKGALYTYVTYSAQPPTRQ